MKSLKNEVFCLSENSHSWLLHSYLDNNHDIIPSQIAIGGVQRILQNLLSEMVSIRDLPTILEAISEPVRSNAITTQITENVRSRLARQISHANMDDKCMEVGENDSMAYLDVTTFITSMHYSLKLFNVIQSNPN